MEISNFWPWRPTVERAFLLFLCSEKPNLSMSFIMSVIYDTIYIVLTLRRG